MRAKRQQYAGCIIGQALGDALGRPVEGFEPSTCREYCQEKLDPTLETGEPNFSWRGQYTDDTQLARELMQSFVEIGRFDPEDFAQRIGAIFKEDRIVGYGQATRGAALRLIRGVPWRESGTPAPSAGNGTAMRAAPVGLFFWHDPEELAAGARDQGWITHRDPRCAAGSVAIAGGVALNLRGDRPEEDRWIETLASWVEPWDADFGKAVRQLHEWKLLDQDKAYAVVSRVGVSADDWDPCPGITPFVVPSVLWSLYSFLRTPDSYRETIRTAIAVGGDVDSTAAMAGAISGAHLGLDRLPASLARRLTDQGTWGFEELVSLAERCHAIVDEWISRES